MTTGRASVKLSACSAQSPCSRISARSLRIRTAARRTVQTLIGSKLALSTSTRPDDPERCAGRPAPCSASAGPGSESPASGRGIRCALTATVRRILARGPGGDRVRPENSQLLDPLPQRRERLADGRQADGPVEVGEEHVVPQRDPARARLDAGQVHSAVRELAQAVDEPAGGLVAAAPED